MTAPIRPERPSLELTLAEQANEAIENGVDPHAATEMLGRMLKHLKANPELSAHGSEALARGIDPHAIAGKVWEMTSGDTAPAVPRKPVLARAGEMIANTAAQFAEHPLDAAVGLVTSPIKAAYTAAFAPGVGEARPDARLSKGGNSSGRPIDQSPYDAAHGGVTQQERNGAGLTAVGSAAFPAIASGVSRPLVEAGVNRALANAVGVTAGGTALGAVTNPNDPIAGGIVGGGTAAVIGGVVPQIGRLARSVGSGTISTLGLRPSGLSAEQIEGGLPTIVQCDNGTEFTSTSLDHWAYWNRVQLDFSRPGKPVDNSVCEAFNGSLRRECLTRHWFASLAEARVVLTSWRDDYNNHRPHTSLGLEPPAVFRGAGVYLPRFRTLEK